MENIMRKIKEMSSEPRKVLEFLKNNCDEETKKMLQPFTNCELRSYFEVPGRIGICVALTEIVGFPCEPELHVSAVCDERKGLFCALSDVPLFGSLAPWANLH